MADAEHALPLALQRASEALILMQEKSFFKESCLVSYVTVLLNAITTTRPGVVLTWK